MSGDRLLELHRRVPDGGTVNEDRDAASDAHVGGEDLASAGGGESDENEPCPVACRFPSETFAEVDSADDGQVVTCAGCDDEAAVACGERTAR